MGRSNQGKRSRLPNILSDCQKKRVQEVENGQTTCVNNKRTRATRFNGRAVCDRRAYLPCTYTNARQSGADGRTVQMAVAGTVLVLAGAQRLSAFVSRTDSQTVHGDGRIEKRTRPLE